MLYFLSGLDKPAEGVFSVLSGMDKPAECRFYVCKNIKIKRIKVQFTITFYVI